ncbi:MAG: DUF2135 domain-containing protein [Pseudomonadota bacterium]|nr:DUF2135 domain-containing protein [Pseudomonadota bacterium]
MKPHKLIAGVVALVAIAASTFAMAQTNQRLAPPLMIAPSAEVPIQLRSLMMDVEVSGGLARTTVDMSFYNPNSRQLEGELQFPLQPGQQVSGFALDIEGRMRPAVPVEKAKGRRVFEAIERRGVDPGLLEQTAGNQFKLRVYPIPAMGERRVRISIDQALERYAGGWRMRLPTGFGEQLKSFPLRVTARGQRSAPKLPGAFGDLAFVPDGDAFTAQVPPRTRGAGGGVTLQFEAAATAQAFVQQLDGQRYFHAEIPLPGEAKPRTMPGTIGLLWDSSGSARNRDIDAELAVLDRYFAAVGDGEVRLIRLRDVAEPIKTFLIAGGDWSALRQALRETVYDGASALTTWEPQNDVQEYLLVSDGLSNYGVASKMPRLAAAQRLYALHSSGANADTGRLAAWADERGGKLVSWQGIAGVADAAQALILESPHLLSVEGLGVDGVVAASRHPQAGYLRVAGRLNQPSATLTLRISTEGREQRIVVPVAADAPASDQVAALWASYTVARLMSEPELNRARIRRLGKQFGLVSAETSLIVLEDLSDYALHDIAPPAEFRKEVARLAAMMIDEREQARHERLGAVVARYAERVEWWQTPWPKGRPKVDPGTEKGPRSGRQRHRAMASAAVAASSAERMMSPGPPPPPPPPPSAAPAMLAEEISLDRVEVTGSRIGAGDDARAQDAGDQSIGIAMQQWQPDSAFARRLRAAAPAAVYAIYLDEREDHAGSSAFYLDVADILFESGQRELALRVLSNLAEMNLENRQLLRVLGYRLLQAGAPELAVPVFERVGYLIDEEPQSFRDLGLAYAASGRPQEALDALYRVVTGDWDRRFPGVDLIALGELNALVANTRAPLDMRNIDSRLLRNLPLDLRVVLSWDSDNSDMDLWVTDPNGEKTYYGNRRSYQGGWMSNDFTGGYGPEEFLLRDAKPGKYKVEANFFGDRQQIVTGATTLNLQLFTAYGTQRQKAESVTMRLSGARETVLVGEFDVR